MTAPHEGSPREPIDVPLGDLFDGRTDPTSPPPTPDPATASTHTETTVTDTPGARPTPEADTDDRTRRTKLTHKIAGIFVDRTIRRELETHDAAHHRKDKHVDASDPLGLAAPGAKARAGVYGDPKTDPEWDWFKTKGYATRMANTHVTRSAKTLRRKVTEATGNDPTRPGRKLSSKLGQPSKINRRANSTLPEGNQRADRITDAHATALWKIVDTNNDALDATYTAQGYPTYEIVSDDKKARPGEILHNQEWADSVLDPANILALKTFLIERGMEKGYAKDSLAFQIESSGILSVYPKEIASYLGISKDAWLSQTGREEGRDQTKFGELEMPETGGANHKIVDKLNMMIKLPDADLQLLIDRPKPKPADARKKEGSADTTERDPILDPMYRVENMTSLREPVTYEDEPDDGSDPERLRTPDGTPWESVLSFVAGRYREDAPGVSYDQASLSSVGDFLAGRIDFFDKAAKHLGYTEESLDAATDAEYDKIEVEAAKIQEYLAQKYLTDLQSHLIIAEEEIPGEGSYKVLKSNEQIMHIRAAYQAKRVADAEAARAESED
jgi:hypothetical protein